MSFLESNAAAGDFADQDVLRSLDTAVDADEALIPFLRSMTPSIKRHDPVSLLPEVFDLRREPLDLEGSSSIFIQPGHRFAYAVSHERGIRQFFRSERRSRTVSSFSLLPIYLVLQTCELLRPSGGVIITPCAARTCMVSPHSLQVKNPLNTNRRSIWG